MSETETAARRTAPAEAAEESGAHLPAARQLPIALQRNPLEWCDGDR